MISVSFGNVSEIIMRVDVVVNVTLNPPKLWKEGV